MIRQRFDADPNPDPTFHFDADRDLGPFASFVHVGKSENCWLLAYIFIFSVNVLGVKISNILDSILKFSGKKYSSALNFVEMNYGIITQITVPGTQ